MQPLGASPVILAEAAEPTLSASRGSGSPTLFVLPGETQSPENQIHRGNAPMPLPAWITASRRPPGCFFASLTPCSARYLPHPPFPPGRFQTGLYNHHLHPQLPRHSSNGTTRPSSQLSTQHSFDRRARRQVQWPGKGGQSGEGTLSGCRAASDAVCGSVSRVLPAVRPMRGCHAAATGRAAGARARTRGLRSLRL